MADFVGERLLNSGRKSEWEKGALLLAAAAAVAVVQQQQQH